MSEVRPDLFRGLFKAVREGCGAGTWSKGVVLSRGHGVTVVREDATEGHYLVQVPDRRVAPEVGLFFEDEDWQCSCGGSEDPCVHVAAAVIALRTANEAGRKLSTSASGYMRYEFRRGERGCLALRRILVDGKGDESPFWGDLTAVAAGRKPGPSVAATDLDLQIDRVFSESQVPELSPVLMRRIFKLMRGYQEALFEGQPIGVSSRSRGWLLESHRQGEQYAVELKTDPEVSQRFANGVVLCGQTLHPAIELPDETIVDQLFHGKLYDSKQFDAFKSNYLHRLRQILLVVGEGLQDELVLTKPYVLMQSRKAESGLQLCGVIAYGKPIVAILKGAHLEKYGEASPARQLNQERLLRDAFAKQTGLELGRDYQFAAAEAIERVRNMRRLGFVFEDGAVDDFRDHGVLDLGLEFDSQHGLQVKVSLADRTEVAEAKAVFAAYDRGEATVALPGGGFGRLPGKWFGQFGQRVRELLEAQSDAGDKLNLALSPIASELMADMDQPIPVDLQAARDRITKTPLEVYRPVEGLHATLRHYQRHGIGWLQNLKRLQLGGLLCDDMGLGKTLQALAVLESPGLVVAPRSLLPNWQAEIAKFRPGLLCHIYHGPGRVLPENGIVITTYQTMRQDIDLLRVKHWRMLIFDESQFLKNPDSLTCKAALLLAADCKIGLTGTPVENRLDDLWSQMQVVLPGYLGSRKRFRTAFGNQTRALKKRLGPFFLRRLKRDVAKELPPKTEVVDYVAMEDLQAQLYHATLAEARAAVAAGSQQTALILTALLRLRQVCSHPALFDPQAHAESAKVTWLLAKLEELRLSGHRAIVFSQWTGMLDLLEKDLNVSKATFLRLDGQTKDRQQVVKAFTGGDHELLLMSLKAGGVGLNLTVADHVFLFDPWWNPAVESQAVDRAHRIGQTKPVFVHRLIALGTVEEKVLALQNKKRELAGEFVDAQMSVSNLSKQELLDLLGE